MGQARDYEALIRELLAGVAVGWSFPDVTFWLWNVGDEEGLTLWLREFAKGLSLERDQELIEQLKLLGKMTPGKLASEALSIVARFDSSDGQGSELLTYEDEIVSFEKIIDVKSNDYWNTHGIDLANSGQYEEAIFSFDKAIQIKLNDNGAWSNRGSVLAELGRYEEAVVSFDKSIQINSDRHQSWSNRGIALTQLGRYEEAVVSFDKAIEIKPNDDEAWITRGAALRNLGKYEEEIVSYDRAIEINSDRHEAWYNRAGVLSILEQYEEAINSYNRAIEIKQDKHEAWSDLAQMIGILDCYQTELNVYDQAFKHIHSETHPEGWGHLQQRIGHTHYEEGINQLLEYRCDPQPYYDLALTHYHNALQTLTRKQFPKLRLDTLIDTAKIYIAKDNTSDAYKCKKGAFEILQDLLNAQPTFEGKKRLQLEYTSLRQLDVDLFIANGDNINALIAAELEKNNRLTWLLLALAEKTISPSYVQMRQLLGIKSVSTTLNIRGLDRAISLPLAKNSLTGIVYWHLSPDNLTTFILTANDSQPLVWESDRRQQAQQLAKWIKEWDTQYRDYGSKKSVATQPSPNGEVSKDEKEHHPWRKNLPNYLAQLQQILEIDKICAQLPATLTHLILILHGDLHRFPLHTLFLASAKLPNLQSCTYLPSIQIGLNLQQRSTPTKSYTPLLSVEDPETHQAEMPFAQIESTIVRHLLQPNTHINSKSADLATVEKELSKPHASFHFTGHAAYNSRSPEASALALTDEPLTAKLISQLDLSSYNLITLAACETAITGRTNINTEYVGLTSAFLQAGAANILSTLWQVDEIANAWFTIYFYQQLLSGKSPAEALAITQGWLQTVTWQNLADWLTEISQLPQLEISIIDRLTARITNIIKEGGTIGLDRPTKYSHPYYWAAFTLTGEG
jgi:CHAT domain-containing protein/tetratricopeptide (TPR) repeat protein